MKHPSSHQLRRKETLTGYLFTFPAMLPLVVFWIFPVVYSFFISFTNWDMMSADMKFVGLKNYVSLLTSPDFGRVLWNTLVFSLGATVPTIVFGFLVALLLNQAAFGIGIYRTIIFAPYITPMVAASIVWSWIYEPRVGILNFVLSLVGLPGLQWNQSSQTAMLSVIIVTVWKQLGYTMIFYMEALRKVPVSLLEAAEIDGASPFSRLRNVILPMVSPTSFFLLIMSTIGTLQAYDQIQVLTQGGPAGATRTLLYFYYQEAFTAFRTGKASAVAVILVVITVVISLLETWGSKKWVHYN